MEEEKAAAYYDELSRKGEGAAKFKQGLGFSASSNSNDAVPSRGSALPSASSFLSNFVRASSPSKNAELEKQAQLQSIQNKLKKKPKEEDKTFSSSRVSKDRDNGNHSRRSRSRDHHSHRRNRSRSRDRHSKRRSRSKDRGRDRHSRRRSRSRSRSRDDYSPKRRYRSRSTSRDRGRERRSTRRSSSCSDEERDRRKNRSVSPRDRRSEKRHKVEKARNSGVDYATVIEGYDKMTPAERVKAKMKLQLSETAVRDETKGMSSGWERFDFDKDAPLDDEEIEAAEDDAALVKHIGQTFRFSTMEARREEQIKAAHDEAIFGALHPPPHDETIFGTSSHPPFTDRDDETEAKSVEISTTESAPLTSLISDQVRTMQQGSWRDRARRA